MVFLGGAEASASPSFALPMFITIKKIIILHLFLGVATPLVLSVPICIIAMNGAPVSESEKNLSIMSITKSVHHVHHKICPSVHHKTTPHGSGLLIKDFLSKTMLKESISLRKLFLKTL